VKMMMKMNLLMTPSQATKLLLQKKSLLSKKLLLPKKLLLAPKKVAAPKKAAALQQDCKATAKKPSHQQAAVKKTVAKQRSINTKKM
jgi:hypothetical protein